MLRFLRSLVVSLFSFSLLAFIWLSFTSVSARDLPPLQTGDVIFHTSRSSQSTAILLASRSPYSHMGLIELDASGHVFVEEATGPVKLTPIDEWIKRGLGGRVMIKRFEGLSMQQGKDILLAAHKYDGLPYDIYFLPDKDHIYCSELVRYAFEEGAKIQLGTMQTVSELKVDNFAARRLIKRRWERDPICQTAGETFETCFTKILQQPLITPASIAADPRMKVIFSNFAALAN